MRAKSTQHENLLLDIKPMTGAKIGEVCSDAKALSEVIDAKIEFVFNGVLLSTENMSINEMVDKYETQQSY